MSFGEVRQSGPGVAAVERRAAEMIERLNQAESDLVNSLDPMSSENGDRRD